MEKCTYTQTVLSLLHQHYPNAKTALYWRNPLELLIATMLSAQCTDARVNLTTPALFKRYSYAQDFADADLTQLQKMIYSTGFYKNKAKNIQAACRKIHDQFKDEVPQTLAELISLPGVARKTANVVLGNAFQRAEGVVVDTHVKRITQRLGLSDKKDPDKIEKDLMKTLPNNEWIFYSHAIVEHGRALCKARKPNCTRCFLSKTCPSAFRV